MIEACEITVPGSFTRIEAAGDGEVAGWTMDKCYGGDGPGGKGEECRYPAIVSHQYGGGKTVYTPFDLCESFTTENSDVLSALFTKAVEFVHHPDEDPQLIPHRVKPFALEITSPGLDFELRVSTTCRPELYLYDPAVDNWLEQYPWEFTLPIRGGETAVVPYYLLAPDQVGTYSCETSTGSEIGGAYTVLNQYLFELEVKKDRVMYIEESMGALEALDVSGPERAMLSTALQSLGKVFDRPVTDCEQTGLNIHDIEKTIDALVGIESVDTAAIRLDLDTLLRIEMGRCYFHE